jgi:hypothetical protein
MKMNNVIRTKHACILAVVIHLITAASAAAQGLEITGNIRAGIAKSDNIFLLPSPDEVEETTYIISPQLNLDYSNQRIESLIRYEYDWFKYSDLDATNEFHRYDARLDTTLVDEALFLDLGASRSQSVVDPDVVIPPGGLPISENLADRDEYFANPRLDKTLGQSVSVLLDYRYADIRYRERESENVTPIQDNTNQSADFELDNYRQGQGFTWALAYEWRETEYEVSLPWEFRRASAELGVWAGSNTRIFASGGKESAWNDPIDRSLQDEFWEAGFAYQNGDRASAEFAAGERSFGSSWRGRLDWTFRRGNLEISYEETPTTYGVNSFASGNLIDPEEPNDFLAFPGRSERFISERGQVGLSLDFRRTSFRLGAFDEARTGRFTDDGTPLEDESQRGVSATIEWQPGSRTEIRASGSVSNRETESGGKTDFALASIAASYRVGRSVGFTLAYQYAKQDPEEESVGNEYVSNTVSFYVTYSF